MSRYARRPAPRHSDHREATLEKIARLRDTINQLQDGEADAFGLDRTQRGQAYGRPAYDEPRAARRSAPSHPLANGSLERDVHRSLRDERVPPRRREESHDAPSRKLEQDLDAMRRQLAELTQTMSEARDGRHADVDRMDERFSGHVQTHVRSLRDDVMGRIEHGLSDVETRLDEQRQQSQRSSKDIEAALRGLTQRFDTETRDLRGAIGQELADQRDAMSETLAEGFGAMADGLASRIGKSFDDASRQAAHRDTAHLDEARRVYSEMTSAIDTLARTDHSSAETTETLVSLHERIDELGDLVSQIGRAVNEAPVLRRLERQIGEIAGGADNAATDVLTERVANLAKAQERLLPLLEKSLPANSALERFETVLTRQSDALERLHSLEGPDAGPQLERLEEVMSRLSARLEDAPAGMDSGINESVGRELDTLVGRIEAGVAASLDGTGLEAVERKLTEMDAKLDAKLETRDAAPASDAPETVALANEAVAEVLETALQQSADDMSGVLRQGLEDLRAAQASESGRTQATLTALHDVLERMFLRMEQEERELPASASFDAAPVRSVPMDPPHQRMEHAAAPLTDDDWAPVEPDDGVDELAPFAAGAAPAVPETRSEFIAQARAAALASQASLGQAGPPDAAPKTGFLSRFKRRKADAQPETTVEDAQDDTTAGTMSDTTVDAPAASSRIRPLIMVATAAALIVGALAVFSVAVQTTPAPERSAQLATPAPIEMDVPRQMTGVAAPAAGSAERGPVTPDQPMAQAARVPDMPPVGVADQFDGQPRQVDARDAEALMPVEMASLPAPRADLAPAAPAPVAPPRPDADLLASLPDALGPAVLREAAAAGDAKAQYEIGERLASGRFGTADPKAAKAWFERASTQDLAPAQYRLASLYEKGVGTERDPDLARTWYERAASQGNARAMHNLGVLYAEGAFGSADFANAVVWFDKAARHGVPDSQFNLGIIHGRGLGGPQDLPTAYMWFETAGKGGDADAVAKRDEVAAVMSAEQLAQGKALVEGLGLVTPRPEANVVSLPNEMLGDVAQDQSEAAAAPPRELVRQVQQLLNLRGYDTGTPDGLVGKRTTAAITRFQQDQGLPATGRATPDFLQALANG